MYLILRGDMSPAVALTAYGHATLGTYLTWRDDPVMQEWERTSFVKVALKAVDKAHFDRCKAFGEHRVFVESSLDNAETCLGFRVVRTPSPRFADLDLWSP